MWIIFIIKNSTMSFASSVKKFLEENPSATDEDVLRFMESNKPSTSSREVVRHDPFSMLFRPFSHGHYFDPVRRFNRISKLFDSFGFDDSHFEDVKFDDADFEDVKPDPTDVGYSRSKYTYTTYRDGKKLKKTVESSHRRDKDGHLKSHRRKTTEDESGKKVEEYFPDGTSKTLQYDGNMRLLQ
jgi:hypothetical protein